jgi:aminoglycoside phosphotransferase family enzyme/predicted kinase
MFTEDQSDTIAFLADPASHGVTDGVRRMETHISMIFLVGGRALKLKRAVKLPYVDFSTPEIRREACRREVAFNGPTAPGLYLGVRAITRQSDGRLAFDGDGDLVDAVVEMVEFPQSCLFDAMADAGALTPSLMRDVADMIVAFHARIPTVHNTDGAANIAGVLDINEAGFATSHLFDPDAVAGLNAAFRAALDGHAALLDRREKAGMVRRCHGDLHLRNICMFGGAPRLFDCIEFNDQIARIDTLYDLAFLLMDLWHRGHRSEASIVMNRYLDRTGDEGGFELLPFFMALRAAVRAHVTATQIEESGHENARLAASARAYFELAVRLLEPSVPGLVVLGGLSGSGKSTVAEALAPRLGVPPGARIVESDRIRKAMFGKTPESRLDLTAYAPEISERVYNALADHAVAIAAAGGAAIADAVFDRAETRAMLESKVRAAGIACTAFWLEADAETMRRRIDARPHGVSDADGHILDLQLAHAPRETGWKGLDAARPVAAIVDDILLALDRPDLIDDNAAGGKND